MAYVAIDVVPNPGGEAPFKIVFKQADAVVAEWPVETQAAGEQQIKELLEEILEEDDEEDDDK